MIKYTASQQRHQPALCVLLKPAGNTCLSIILLNLKVWMDLYTTTGNANEALSLNREHTHT